MVYSKIESSSNPKVKHLVRLRKSSRYRTETGLFIVEGKREVEAILSTGRTLEEIYFSESIKKERESSSMLRSLCEGVPSFELSEKAMNKVSYRSQTSTIIGVAKIWNIEMKNFIESEVEFILVLDEVEKPGNLGALLRTAEAMGVEAVLLSDSCVDFFNPNVIRSSSGLFASMPVFTGNKIDIYERAKKSNLEVVGTSSKASTSIYEYTFKSNIALVMGSESKGLGEFWEKNSDSMISIPMYGEASSLNLNSATACILFEINRRKHLSKTS